METTSELDDKWPRSQATLAELGLVTSVGQDIVINGISANSRTVKSGYLFAALPGSRIHGAKFVDDAINRGASIILTDKSGEVAVKDCRSTTGVNIAVVEDPRSVLSIAAARWFQKSPEKIAAVTGTNGKTSVVSICQQLWQLLGKSAVSLGTLGVDGIWSASLEHTTPDPITLHKRLAQAAEQGVTHAAIEASSHGLAQRRLDGVRLFAAAFTNLTHDHLDYHETKEAYYMAKASLFERVLPKNGTAIVNTDTEFGSRMAEAAHLQGQKVISVGREQADLALLRQQFTKKGQSIRFRFHGRVYETESCLMGGFQAWNLLAAAGLVIASGERPESVFDKLSEVKPIRGRLQLAAERVNGSFVFVDYAHTPDALRASITSLREHFVGRVLALIGAGGDRDRTKRSVMGEVAHRLADTVIVTDDNPRSESPAEIRADILCGCRQGIEIADRAEAIVRGAAMLSPGDVLLVAGKGHESGQEIGGTTLPFNEFEQASIAVRALDGIGT